VGVAKGYDQETGKEFLSRSAGEKKSGRAKGRNKKKKKLIGRDLLVVTGISRKEGLYQEKT